MKKRLIAMLLVFAMVLAMAPAAFAAEPQKKYVSLGDSMTNGYGLDNYEKPWPESFVDGYGDTKPAGEIKNWFGFMRNDVTGSYPWKVADHFDWELSQIATSGLRADDVYYLLNLGTDYEVNWDEYGRQYMADKFRQAYYDAHNRAGTNEEVIAWAAEIYQAEVKDADVISIGIGSNNFATLMDMRMMWWMGRILGDESMFSGGGYQGAFDFNELVSDMTAEQKAEIAEMYNDIYAEIEAVLMESAAEIGLSMDAPLTVDGATFGDLVADITNAIAYTSAGFALGYKGIIDTIIRENNDAEIIIVGLTNWFRGMVYGIPVGEEMFEFPMGDLMELVCDFAGVYMAALPAAYDLAAQLNGTVMQPIYFADTNAAGVEDVELIVDEIVDNTAEVDLDSLDAFELGSDERFEAARAIAEGITAATDIPGGTTRDRLLEAMRQYVLSMMAPLGIVAPTMAQVNAADAAIAAYYDPANATVVDAIKAQFDSLPATREEADVLVGLGYLSDASLNQAEIGSPLTMYLGVQGLDNLPGCIAYLGLEKSMISSLHLDVVNVKHFDILSSVTNLMNVTMGALDGHMGDINDIGGALIAVPELGTVSNLMFNFLVGSGVIVHPSDDGHTTIANVIIDAYENEHTATEETFANLAEALKFAYDYVCANYEEIYAAAWQIADDNGYIAIANGYIAEAKAAVEALDVDALTVSDELKAELNALKASVLADIAALEAIVNSPEHAGAAANFRPLMVELYNDLAALQAVATQAGEDAYGQLMILHGQIMTQLNTAYNEACRKACEQLGQAYTYIMDELTRIAGEQNAAAAALFEKYMGQSPADFIESVKQFGADVEAFVNYWSYYAEMLLGPAWNAYGDDIIAALEEYAAKLIPVLEDLSADAADALVAYIEELGIVENFTAIAEELKNGGLNIGQTALSEIEGIVTALESDLAQNAAAVVAALEALANGSDVAEAKNIIANAIAAIKATEADRLAALGDIHSDIITAKAAVEAAIADINDLYEAVDALAIFLAAPSVDFDFDATVTAVTTLFTELSNAAGTVKTAAAQITALTEDITTAAQSIDAEVKAAKSEIETALTDIGAVLANAGADTEALLKAAYTAADAYLGVTLPKVEADVTALLAICENEVTVAITNVIEAIETAVNNALTGEVTVGCDGDVKEVRVDGTNMDVAGADVVVVDFGAANFVEFLTEQINGVLAEAANTAIAEALPQAADPGSPMYSTYEQMFVEAIAGFIDLNAVANEINWQALVDAKAAGVIDETLDNVVEILVMEGLPAEYVIAVHELMGLNFPVNVTIDVDGIARELIDTIAYSYAAYVAEFTAKLDAIHAAAPNAEVAVVALKLPAADELKLTVGTFPLALGEYAEYMQYAVDFINLHYFAYAVATENTIYVEDEATLTYVITAVPAEHDYKVEKVDATCTEPGSITTTCTGCDYKDVEVIPATGHVYGDDDICDVCKHNRNPIVWYPTVAPVDKVGAFKDLQEIFAENPDIWWREAVEYVINNDLMDGVSDTEFAPYATTTRAMLVTILWREEGSPIVNYDMGFEDVAAGQWYTNAIRWAASKGIVDGMSDTEFAPNAKITREQLVAIFYRYAKYKNVDVSKGDDATVTTFTDVEEVSNWAYDALEWACGIKFVEGKENNNIDPTGNANRAEMATLIMRFIEDVM